MSLLTMPPEVLCAIIRHLDTKSVLGLYRSGVVCIQGILKEAKISTHSAATAATLRSDFFIGVAPYLTVLNLSGVPDLTILDLQSAIAEMKYLVDLDVTYTNVIMLDFLQIVKDRPTLKNIAINFSFDHHNLKYSEGRDDNLNKDAFKDIEDILRQVSEEEVLSTYQEAFAGFKKVHLVGNIHEPTPGSLAVRMLEKADLVDLKLTAKDLVYETSNIRCEPLKTTVKELLQFQVHVPKSKCMEQLPIYDAVDFSKYEILLLLADDDGTRTTKVGATPILKDVIADNLPIEVEGFEGSVQSFLSQHCKRNSVVFLPFFVSVSDPKADIVAMFWNRDRTDFDAEFRAKLLRVVREYFVFNCSSVSAISGEFNWYRIECNKLSSGKSEPRAVDLDYGLIFKDQQDIKLKIVLDIPLVFNVPLNIRNNFGFLSKLTHLCLQGSVDFTAQFFKRIFEECSSLQTLEIETEKLDSNSLQYMSLSKTLRNFSVLSTLDLPLASYFAHLSECRTLENVFLSAEEKQKYSEIPDPKELFRKCGNLYNVCIKVPLRMEAQGIGMRDLFQKAMAEFGRDAVRVVLSTDNRTPVPYYSYLAVFRLLYPMSC